MGEAVRLGKELDTTRLDSWYLYINAAPSFTEGVGNPEIATKLAQMSLESRSTVTELEDGLLFTFFKEGMTEAKAVLTGYSALLETFERSGDSFTISEASLIQEDLALSAMQMDTLPPVIDITEQLRQIEQELIALNQAS